MEFVIVYFIEDALLSETGLSEILFSLSIIRPFNISVFFSLLYFIIF